ncbi:hypothetical protein GH714_023951 [Hevea brasiliensis]|uniref:Menaquinone biosynthesis methyltransferase ubiE-like protein n=1 Tax=Hevea brasiliensis TaxID=3981 RepID=A0A6A6KFN2_HEVBR|nr:hypothetical protein GH714_023951 [Hevea brasiliensis]
MASLQVGLSFPCGPRTSIYRFRNRPVRCTNERRALFSRIAPVYDDVHPVSPLFLLFYFILFHVIYDFFLSEQLNDLLSLGQHRIWKRMAVSWTGAKIGDNVLDLCCGSGDLAFLLSEKVGSSGKVTGVDFSKEQLLIASSRQQLSPKECYQNIDSKRRYSCIEDRWLEGDATDLPFSDCAKASVLDFNKSTQPFVASFQEWMIDNVVLPVASAYGLAKEYEYLKSSIREFLTGKELEELALEAGFSTAKHYEISGGLMGNLVATR